MKQYMVIAIIEGAQSAYFYDTYDEACSAHMDICVSIGGYAEVYERCQIDEGFESYQLLYA